MSAAQERDATDPASVRAKLDHDASYLEGVSVQAPAAVVDGLVRHGDLQPHTDCHHLQWDCSVAFSRQSLITDWAQAYSTGHARGRYLGCAVQA